MLALALAATTATGQPEPEVIEVAPGDTLFGLVRLHYPDEPGRWSMLENEIYKNNPGAFSGDSKANLQVGAMLRLPPRTRPAAPEPEPEPATPPKQPLERIGNVAEISGTPLAIDVNNEQRDLQLGSEIYRGDAILTENGSETRLEMNDGAQIHLRAGSRMLIEDHRYVEAAPANSRSIFTLLKGGFRAITGLIGRDNPSSVRINTAVATLGIRGTDFGVRICGADDCVLPDTGPFEPGNYSGVLDGEITISNAAGVVPVATGEFMRTSSPDAAPVPAPEAARLVFSDEELALLQPAPEEKPMNFFQWLRQRLFGD